MFQPFWTTASKNPAATEVSNCLLWRLNPANPGIKTRQLDMSDTQTPDLATHGSRLLIVAHINGFQCPQTQTKTLSPGARPPVDFLLLPS